MSKSSHRQQEKELKVRIDDFVGPILRQLVEAKNHEDSSPRRSDIEKVCTLIENMRSVLENRKKWESKLMGHFERIQRQLNNENKGEDNEGKNNDNEWVWVIEKLEKLLRNQEVLNIPMVSRESANEASDLPQKSATSEIGEPSSNSNRNYVSIMQFDEYINQLSPEHRDCLYSLCIFPENAKLKKRLLLYWWIGLGLPLGENKNITTEQVAETFFCDLLKRGVLQPIHTRRHNQVVDCCIINPTIHRRLFSTCKNQKRLPDMKHNEGNLQFYCDDNSQVRALLNLNDQYLNSEDISNGVLSVHRTMQNGHHPTMQNVQFGNWHCTERTKFMDHIEVDKTDFLEKLGKKVAFLSLRNILGIERLPNSIGKLEELRILDLRACHNLENLPRKLWSKSHKILGLVFRQQKWLKNLTYLDISECFQLDNTPKWVCELFNLEVLKGFVASNVGKEKELCRLGDLLKLEKLRKLSVRIAMHLDPVDLSALTPLESLSVLTLIWGANKQSKDEQIIMPDQAENQYKCIDNGSDQVRIISFPKNLEKLDIWCYPKSEAQELLNPTMLQKLKRLYVRGGKLTNIGKKPGWNVEILRLRYLKHLDMHLYFLDNIFTKLKCMEYEQCINRKYCPKEMSYWSKETDGPFQITFPKADYWNREVLIDGRVQLAVTQNMADPLARHKQKMMLELIGWDSISDRPGLDLVLVVDVSMSMNENFIKELKTAMLFVIEKLSSIDRLSIVTFSEEATIVYPLCQVTKTSQKEAETLVTNLKATNDIHTNAVRGLEMGLKILKDRSNSSGRVAGIMMVLVGQSRNISKFFKNIYDVAVHTFLLGPASDEQVLNIALFAFGSMGGTFSDVSIAENLTKAFSVCLAGLLTVAVQDLTLTISPIKHQSTKVEVHDVRYPKSKNEADCSITIKFGVLYSKEVRKIVVDLELPATDKDCDSNVLKISCSYKAKEVLTVPKPAFVTVTRLADVSAPQHRDPPQVLVEVNRQKIAHMIHVAFNVGNVERKIIDAQNILEDLVKTEPQFSKELFEGMGNELKQIWSYGKVDCPFLYSFRVSHSIQRAAVRGFHDENPPIFSTPTMVEFLMQAEKFRAHTRVEQILNSNPSEDS